jgi:hypothetical protein
VVEIIGKDWIIDYSNTDAIFSKLMNIKENKIRLNLDPKYMQDHNIKLWVNLIGIL